MKNLKKYEGIWKNMKKHGKNMKKYKNMKKLKKYVKIQNLFKNLFLFLNSYTQITSRQPPALALLF